MVGIPSFTYDAVAEYMTQLVPMRSTGWFAFFSLSDLAKVTKLKVAQSLQDSPGLSKGKAGFKEGFSAFSQVLNTLDMVFRVQEVDFSGADVTFTAESTLLGEQMIKAFTTNNVVKVSIIETNLATTDQFFHSWRDDFYDQEKRAFRSYNPILLKTYGIKRAPYKRDMIAVHLDWAGDFPIISRIKIASGIFPLSHTLNNEKYSYKDDAIGTIDVELAADMVQTITINPESIVDSF